MDLEVGKKLEYLKLYSTDQLLMVVWLFIQRKNKKERQSNHPLWFCHYLNKLHIIL